MTVAGKRVVVLDDVIDDALIAFFDRGRSASFSLSDYDSKETAYSLHWRRNIDPKWVAPLVDLARTVFDDRALKLEVAHLNVHLFGDVQFPHQDGGPGWVTLLLFANRVWKPSWMGETIFYESPEEPAIAVLPRPGRVVIFEGDILHRAGVPQRECFEPRLTLALKLGPAGTKRTK